MSRIWSFILCLLGCHGLRVLTLTMCFNLTMTSVTHAQITIGDAVLPGDLDKARATLEKATPKSLALEIGEFEILEPAKSLTTPLLWILSNDAIVQRIELPHSSRLHSG